MPRGANGSIASNLRKAHFKRAVMNEYKVVVCASKHGLLQEPQAQDPSLA